MFAILKFWATEIPEPGLFYTTANRRSKNIRGSRSSRGCFVHFPNIQTSGYRLLHAGQQVRFTFEQPGFLQDDYPYRAMVVWPNDEV